MARSKGRKQTRAVRRSGAAWLFVAALAFACRGGPPPTPPPTVMTLNTGLPPIDVRYGLDVEDVELGILLGIANPSPAPVLDPGQTIGDDLLPAILAGATRARGPDRPWFYTGREAGLVFAGYESGAVGMRVAIRYDDEMVLLRIVESRNLDQTEDSISEVALTLLDDLDERIRRSVLAVAQRNRYGRAIPSKR